MLKRVQHDKRKGVIPNQVLNLIQDLPISAMARNHLCLCYCRSFVTEIWGLCEIWNLIIGV